MGHARHRWQRSDPTDEPWWRAELPRSEHPRESRASQRSRRDAPRASRNTHKQKGRDRELDDAQLSRAVQSLYDDQLKPYGRILRKRLTEHALAAGRGVPDGDLAKLRARCERLELLAVLEEQGGEWSATFRDEPEDVAFINVYSADDPYPESMWQQIKEYCQRLTDKDAPLPGGRYACAMALYEKHLPFLKEYTLGQVCHIVQLAISQRKVLGYGEGGILPYEGSKSMKKDYDAATQSVESRWHGAAVTTWEEIRWQLQEILQEAEASGQGQVALSNIKQVFRAKFQRELCETALGHSKVSELLQDPRMSDICQVRLFQSGYQVLPASERPLGWAKDHERDARSTAAPGSSLGQSPLSGPLPEPTPTVLASLAGWLDLQRNGFLSVRNTFVECRGTFETEADGSRALSAPPRSRAHVESEPLRPRVVSDAFFGTTPAPP